jgi:hypothetical protein
MKNYCPNCHLVAKHYLLNSGLLWGCFFLGIGLTNIEGEVFGSRTISLILAVILIPAGFTILLSYFFSLNKCPSCGNRGMIQFSSQETLNKPKKETHSTNYICKECFKMSDFIFTKKQNKYGSLALSLFGVLGVFYSVFGEPNTQFFALLGYIIFLGAGIYGLYTNYTFTGYCSQCGKSNTTIPLDSPRAQALIKEHNLTVPTK